jgi:hypothetical protein
VQEHTLLSTLFTPWLMVPVGCLVMWTRSEQHHQKLRFCGRRFCSVTAQISELAAAATEAILRLICMVCRGIWKPIGGLQLVGMVVVAFIGHHLAPRLAPMSCIHR